MIDLPKAPEYPVLATLHFLPGGHYLFRSERKGTVAKFVTAADVRAAFNQREEDSGWMPAGVVRCGHNAKGPWYAYSAPAQTVTVSIEGDPAPLRVPMPRTALISVGGTYWMFASRDEHFNPGGAAYLPPTPNVYSDGRVCWGSATPGETRPAQARITWELFFGNSAFNAHLVDRRCNSQPADVRELLRELAAGKKRQFPAHELVEMAGRPSFERLLKSLTGGEA